MQNFGFAGTDAIPPAAAEFVMQSSVSVFNAFFVVLLIITE